MGAAYKNKGVAAGAVIDGTGLTSTVPLTIKNAKAASGLDIQVVGTAASGVSFRDASAVVQGAIGYAVSGGDWVTGSGAGNLAITSSSYVYIRGMGSGVKLFSASGAGFLTVDDSVGIQIGANAHRFNTDGNGFTFQFGSNAAAVFVTGGTNNATSGTSHAINPTGAFAPTSGNGAYRQYDATYTVNQTGGANGAVHGIRVAATETAVVGTHALIELLAGAAGATTMFKVDNTGLITSGLAMVANGGGAAPTVGTIGGTGPAAAAQSGWMKVNIAGTNRFIPVWT